MTLPQTPPAVPPASADSVPAPETSPAASSSKLSRWKEAWNQYGTWLLGTYLFIFAATWVGFAVAIQAGFKPSSGLGTTGVIASAYAATKLSQPVRIAGALALTPLVKRIFSRRPKHENQ